MASRYPPLLHLEAAHPTHPPAPLAPPPFADHPQLCTLHPEVQHRIDMLLSRAHGIVTLQHFEGPVLDRLLEVGFQEQMMVVEDLLRDNLSTIRNPVAYIMGIIRRYVRGEPSVRGGARKRAMEGGRAY